MATFCGDRLLDGNNNSLTDSTESLTYRHKECITDLSNLLLNCVLSVIICCILVHHCFKKKNSQDKNTVLYFYEHSSRWVLSACLICVCGFEFAQGVLTHFVFNMKDDYNLHVFITPLMSEIGAVLAILYYHKAESNNVPKYLLLLVIYWPLSALSKVAKLLVLYESGLGMQHLSLQLTWALVIVYSLLTGIELSVLLQQKYLFRKIPESPPSRDVTDVKYLHNYVTLLSKATFYWLLPLLRIGYRRPIEFEDLGTLPEEEKADHQFHLFNEIYMDEKAKAEARGKTISLWKCYWRRFWSTLAVGGIIKIIGDMMGLIGPLSISVIIAFVERYQNKDVFVEIEAVTCWDFLQNGYVMACIVLLATFMQSTFSNNFNHLAIIEGLHLKSALQVLIYKKSLRMTSSSSLEMGGVINHMSVDTLNMMMLFSMGHYIWAVPFKIVLLLVLLYLQLGYSALIGAATIYILAPFQYKLCAKLSQIQKETLDFSDERLRKTTELLQGIKLLKLYGWEIMYGQLINAVREKELKLLRKDAIYVAINTFITQASSILVTLVTFAIYSQIEGKALTPSEVFTGLALFNQLTVPLYIIPFVIPIVINSVVSTGRLTKFLSLPEVDTSVPWRDIEFPSATVEFKPESGSVFLHIHDREFSSPFSFDDSDGVFLPELQSYSPKEDPVSIEIQDGWFTWSPDNPQPVLRDINIQIPPGKLTIIVGSVGCGKSSLLSALIGELTVMKGCVKWSSLVPGVAFVPQKPWLLNTTLKENILFGQPYDVRRYHQIIQACALQPDIDLLPARDLTEIGERGLNLSGGQRQRIALARAFYSQAKTVVLDDPLSALDAHVASHIMEQGIKTMLIRRHRTVIMVTNKVEFLPHANKIITLEAGKVKCQGTYSEMENSQKDLVRAWKNIVKRLEKIRQKKPEEGTSRERNKLFRMLSRQVLYRSGSTTADSRSSFKPRVLSFARQMSHHDPSSPLPCHDWEDNDNPWSFSQSDNGERLTSRSVNVVNSSDSLHSKSSGSSGVFFRYSLRKMPISRMNSRISAHTPDLIEEENEDEVDETTNTKDKQETAALNSSSTTLQLPSGKLVIAEDRERGQISKLVYLMYMRACSIPVSIAVILLIISTQTIKVGTDFWLSEWSSVSNSSQISSTAYENETHNYMIGYAAFSVAGIVLSLFTNLFAQLASLKAVRIMHFRMLENIIHCPMKFFDTTPVGRILNRFSSDINVIDKKLPVALPVLLRFILLCISAVIVDIAITPYFLFAIIPIMGVYYFLQHFFRYSSRELQRLDSITKSPIFSLFSETLSGLTTIRAFQEEKRFTEQLYYHINNNNTAFTIASCANCWLGVALDYLGGIILFIATLAAMTAGVLGHISPAFVGMSMTYTLLVPIYLNWVVRNVASVEMYMSAVERVYNYSNLPVENYAGVDAQILPSSWPNAGEIQFHGVTLKYDTAEDTVLKNVTLTIKPGEKVGICGRTGSGKSSLVMALFRMLTITEGKIVIDDINITALPLEVLRSKISIIPQDTILFPGTIRENLDPGNLYSDDELWSALEISRLREIVAAYKEGLDFEVADEGSNFSAGQRQLFCLARAVLRKSKILVMDEATASLDGETDQILQDVVAKYWANSTILTIAHRVASIINYDRVIVLESGRIAEIGKPKELAELRGSIFASLVKATKQA